MTVGSRSAPGAVPDADALGQVCRSFGVEPDDAVLLHSRSNAVYHLPHADTVVRLAPDTALRQQRATTVVQISRWLATAEPLIALEPLPGTQPVVGAAAVATFWPYRASSTAPSLADLATLLRELHARDAPPFPLPDYRPLHRLQEALTIDNGRPSPVLPQDDRAWLVDRTDDLLAQFAALRFPLGIGLVHGDPHDGNLVHDRRHGWLLIDWDSACRGPRELDLLIGLSDHFHVDGARRRDFLKTYGYDLSGWEHWPVLRDIAELHSLASYVRLAPSKPAAAQELTHRLRSLRANDRAARWTPVP